MSLTAIQGILVGHSTDTKNNTGCTAVLCPKGAVPGVFVAGFAPGSYELELLRPMPRVEEVHGILLTGGSAFGLAAAPGVVRWLSEKGYGLETLYAKVPLVAGAVIYDLFFNQTLSKPDFDMGYQAAAAAGAGPVKLGCIGAGTGATAGKMAGFEHCMKTGLGGAKAEIGAVTVATLAVPNPVGSIVDPDTGRVLAGVRADDGKSLLPPNQSLMDLASLIRTPESNTVLVVVATNAKLSKVQASRVARMASAGIARAVRPAHLLYDGDVVFTLASGHGPEMDENIIGAVAADLTAEAIVRGATGAVGLPGCPAHQDLAS